MLAHISDCMTIFMKQLPYMIGMPVIAVSMSSVLKTFKIGSVLL